MNTTLIVLVGLGALIAYIVYTVRKVKRMPEAPQSQNVINLNAGNFNQQIKNGVTLVDFWAAWCMPCKMMAPILNEVADEVKDQAKVAKLNVEEYQQVANTYKVRSIPTLIIFKNGKEIDRIVGVKNKAYLLNKLNSAKLS